MTAFLRPRQTGQTGQTGRAGFSPRNPWARLLAAIEGPGDPAALRETLDALRYHPALPKEVFALLERRLGLPAPDPGGARGTAPLRRMEAGREVPFPYPALMALPRITGSGNDSRFIADMAAGLAAQARPSRMRRVHVALSGPDIAATARSLAAQDFAGTIRLTVFAERPDPTLDLPAALMPEIVEGGILGAAAADRLARIAAEADMVLFVSGTARFDAGAVARATHLLEASDALALGLVPFVPEAPLDTPFAPPQSRFFASRHPFREMRGLNMAVPAALLRRAGLPDTRFSGTRRAGMELAFRMVNDGAWLAPLRVPDLRPEADDTPEDRALYTALCPNAWDRSGKGGDGRFEVPRVGVYIAAFNARRYLCRAIDSILDQDVADLEVCIADDGSCDGTADMLERRYGGLDRVRWQGGRNGGIGHASNRAIGMIRAPYIGQLDADDRLKPGAVRRLMEVLDENPDVVCAYGSCERIDAAGGYVQDEYSWPVFSREKMMVTSIAHHFRMFRRTAWARSGKFREDIANAVDYDFFLKLSETGKMRHVDEVLYQRRWHGRNTSNVNETFQTANTHRVQREALGRLGLARFWDVKVLDTAQPRRITYMRRPRAPLVLFWPDYSWSNPYQPLLYGGLRHRTEVCAGDIDTALQAIWMMDDPADLTFHLHWVNFLFLDAADRTEAQARAAAFLERLDRFLSIGGRLVWTIHNTLSHDSPFADIEAGLAAGIARRAHVLHVHSAGQVAEIAQQFDIPAHKARVSAHGNYIGAYPDIVTRAEARRQLGLDDADDVILMSGQIRPYKGAEDLVAVVRRLLAERPRTLLLLAGRDKFGALDGLLAELAPTERDRIRATGRFVADSEMQVFFRAADFAVYPYRAILTSGSMLLALSFGLPTILPDVAMTREVLEGRDAGLLYDAAEGRDALEKAVRTLLARKDAGDLPQIAANARQTAERWPWPDFGAVLDWRGGGQDARN
ncbi:Chondroitin Polymerase [Oceaniovalibus guishaninsula JLT2003]|uniref:Chondroitin Polymerase n=1 Tax=Oceaniovalibus guishaninsula JLT2003 TaxID=1231392 RepID=K2H6K3_9RHOB|nr:glycosyltransferase [Oceaniovalibus guishaninsula]EKE43268.1 Chondroitin Polymerase [Oceaniovalibus guishaninsula JLT2003]